MTTSVHYGRLSIDGEQTESLLSPKVTIVFRQNHFLQSCTKEFINFLSECIVNLLEGNLQSVKRHLVTYLENDIRLLSLKSLGSKEDVLASEKGLQLMKVKTPPVIKRLPWLGAVGSCP